MHDVYIKTLHIKVAKNIYFVIEMHATLKIYIITKS